MYPINQITSYRWSKESKQKRKRKGLEFLDSNPHHKQPKRFQPSISPFLALLSRKTNGGKGKKRKESIIGAKESVGHEAEAKKTKESIKNEVLPIENGELLLLSSDCYSLQLHLPAK